MYIFLLLITLAESTMLFQQTVTRNSDGISTINGIRGNNVALICKGVNVTWVYYRPSSIRENVIYENSKLLNARYSISLYKKENIYRLVISNIKFIDEGDYLCLNSTNVFEIYQVTVSHNAMSNTEKKFKEIVDKEFTPNRITQHFIDLKDGDTFNMLCNSSFSAYKIDNLQVWHYKNAASIQNKFNIILYNEFIDDSYYSSIESLKMYQNNSSYIITLSNVTACDAGIYSCQIINDDSSADIYYLNILTNTINKCRYHKITNYKKIIKRRYKVKKSEQEIQWVRYLRDLYQ